MIRNPMQPRLRCELMPVPMNLDNKHVLAQILSDIYTLSTGVRHILKSSVAGERILSMWEEISS